MPSEYVVNYTGSVEIYLIKICTSYKDNGAFEFQIVGRQFGGVF